MQFSNMGDLYIKTSDESLVNFANYSFLAYLSSKVDIFVKPILIYHLFDVFYTILLAYFNEFRKYIVYGHLAYNHIMIRLFGERYVDPLFWIREEIIEVVDSRRKTPNVDEFNLVFSKKT